MGKSQKKTGKGRLDKYYHLAKDQGYRARSAFKLVQLNKKYNFLENARCCIDLCAAPGGWLQVASKFMPPNSVIIGVDLVPIKPIPRVVTFATDITTPLCRQQLRGELKTWKADVVLHDGAPNVGTAWVQDAYAQSELVLMSLKLAVEFLEKGGTFVTKVFRSKDYNNLLWVFNQLFKKVEATKPPSSRNVSAEIFVVCQDFLAPARIDPRFLDPKEVFKDLSALPVASSSAAVKGTGNVNTQANVFQPDKTRRQRDGYAEGDYTLFKAMPVSEFIAHADPVFCLGSVNRISFEGEEDKKIFKSEETTAEIKSCCADLKVLGKRDFKNLIKWRLAIREELGLDVKVTATDDAVEDDVEVLPVDEDEQMEEDLERLKAEASARAKRERRKANEKKTRTIQRMQLKMTAPLDIGLEQDDAALRGEIDYGEDVFDLTHAERDLRGRGVGASLRDRGLESDDESDEEAAVGKERAPVQDEVVDSEEEEERRVEGLEDQLDGMYDEYRARMSERDAKFKVKELRRKDEHREAWGGIREDGEGGSDAEEGEGEEESADEGWEEAQARKARLGEDSESEWDNEEEEQEEEERPRKRAKADKGANLLTDLAPRAPAGGERATRAAQVWFDNPLFKSVDGLEELDDEEEEDEEEEDVADEDEDEDEDEGDEDEEMASDDDFEVVPPEEDDGTVWDVEDENEDAVRQKRIEDVGLITEEAMSLAYRLVNHQTTKSRLIDEGFNKAAFADKGGLPSWFLDDEGKHYKSNIPITKAAVEALKARQRALDARPIKKIAEAKARAKYKAQQRLAKAQKKADAVMETQDLSEREKAMNITKLLNKGSSAKAKKREVKVVVAKGANRGLQGRPKGVKGRYKMVDPRLRKELRAKKRIEKRDKKRKRN